MTNSDFFKWIDAHAADDPAKLRLKYHNATGSFDYDFAILQIECRRKFRTKFARTLAAAPEFIFPTSLAAEQATGDLAAQYHSSLIPQNGVVADLTAGLGIDAFTMAGKASAVTAVELDHDRAEALRHNAAALRADNVEVVEGDCADFIADCVARSRRFDAVFIDPARRNDAGGRVYALADCKPDIIALMPEIEKITDLLVIKASPMLDITHTASSLPHKPFSIVALGTASECKELIVIVNFAEREAETIIEAITLSGDSAETFAFTRAEEDDAPMPPCTPQAEAGHWLYESSPAVMKSGAFRCLAKAYGLSIFHPNTKLFHSANATDGFPGNRYRIIEVLPYASKIIKRFKSRYSTINVAVRNFGMTADALRAKLNVADGGTLKLFGVTDSRGERILIVAEKC